MASWLKDPIQQFNVEVSVRVQVDNGTVFHPMSSIKILIVFLGDPIPMPLDDNRVTRRVAVTCVIGKDNILEEMCDIKMTVPLHHSKDTLADSTQEFVAHLIGNGNLFAPYSVISLWASPILATGYPEGATPIIGNYNVFEAHSTSSSENQKSRRIGNGNVVSAGAVMDTSLSGSVVNVPSILNEKVFFVLDCDLLASNMMINSSCESLLQVREHAEGTEKNKMDLQLKVADSVNIIKEHHKIL
eukprot:CAMPEP_0113321402 /NCGR_PEP_ID=MMETSP0010_2-20120614/14905_1 /TAXON_ID=216773 ORGANISM="Corethron hystrix, Strain 308" /NCGR_SAMPLE_ID=MMETSP0010_2 /ASSEMBLY_ACC=CAM_ASM_000155 /LENGTH=243 /DNA_ID=CAMNT_0000179537 /DNA_START=14 /DNA_END=745 /DNA_ORIENTATION=+ /assembly_acc=CAM_ASM_000155